MNNLIFGVATFVICACLYIYSWRQHKFGNDGRSLGLLLIGGFILRIYASSDLYIHQWDESFHALVAKNLTQHPLRFTLYENPVLPYDYRNWMENHVWLHKPPLPLWTMALSIWTFGANEFAVRLPSIILTTAGIWLTYEIARHFYTKRIAWIAAFLFSIHGLIIAAASGRVGQDHVDVFFLFFVELAVFFSVRFVQTDKPVFHVWVGVSIGAAILSKWLPALIVMPVWGLTLLHAKKYSLKTILMYSVIVVMAFAVVFLPWQLYIFKTYPLEASWEYGTYRKHITEALEGHDGPFYFYFDWLRIIYGDIVYLPVLWFLWKSITKFRNYSFALFSLWFLVPYLFFSFAKTKTINYTLFTSPALFIITSYYWNYLYTYRTKATYKWLAYTVLVLLLALPVRYTTEKIRCFEQRETNPRWAKELRELNHETQAGKTLMFNISRPIEAMFYTEATAYSRVPSKSELERFVNEGYQVYLVDGTQLDESLKAIRGITLLQLSE